MIDQFMAARKVGTPLLAIRTTDLARTTETILSQVATDIPVYLWDCINGVTWLNNQGKSNDPWKKPDLSNPVEVLVSAQEMPEKAILLLANPHRILQDDESTRIRNWVQAIWNLREPFKRTGRSVVILCPDIQLPPELAGDVVMLDEPLPNPEALRTTVLQILEAGGELNPDPAMVDKAVDAICGLASFPAEQVTVMSLAKDKVTKTLYFRMEDLWRRKYQMIEQTPGLAVWRGGESFEGIGGYDNLKSFLRRIVAGKRAPRCIVFLDEIEKLFGGATSGSDTSGVSQSFLASLLSYMEDSGASGIILIGPPGSGKSQFAKAMGTQAACPNIVFDLNGMKGSLVGESEGRMRDALKVVTAVGQGKVFFIATCNRIASLPPELRRRFRSGTFFVDLPNAEERETIWSIYLQKYGIPGDEPRPDDTDWTGAEIKQCCILAAEELGCTLVDAAKYIVPVAKSAEREIGELRAQAHGRFISASNEGFYHSSNVSAAQSGIRSLESIPED